MNTFVQFNGENYDEILNFTPGFLRFNGKTCRLFIFIPFEGKVEVHKGDYILNENNKLRIRK